MELQPLVRNVLISSAGGPEIRVPVRLGESTLFRFDVVGDLQVSSCGQELAVRAHGGRLVSSSASATVLLRRPDAKENHGLPIRAKFTTDTTQDTLIATLWQKLFPFDFQEQSQLLVPLLGRILWRRLVSEGKIPKDARIAAINVETQECRMFDDMVDGLKWAASFGKPTVYFREYVPEFWRTGLRETRADGEG